MKYDNIYSNTFYRYFHIELVILREKAMIVHLSIILLSYFSTIWNHSLQDVFHWIIKLVSLLFFNVFKFFHEKKLLFLRENISFFHFIFKKREKICYNCKVLKKIEFHFVLFQELLSTFSLDSHLHEQFFFFFFLID